MFRGPILCALDFSSGSGLALEMACDMAHSSGTKLILVHVHELPVGQGEDPLRDQPALEELARCAARARERGIEIVDTQLAHGHAWHRLVDLSRDEGCSLIVVGMHGHDDPRQSPLGRVAEEVTRHASCSVLVVRAEPHAAAARVAWGDGRGARSA